MMNLLAFYLRVKIVPIVFPPLFILSKIKGKWIRLKIKK